jgi:hypothetical protein
MFQSSEVTQRVNNGIGHADKRAFAQHNDPARGAIVNSTITANSKDGGKKRGRKPKSFAQPNAQETSKTDTDD